MRQFDPILGEDIDDETDDIYIDTLYPMKGGGKSWD